MIEPAEFARIAPCASPDLSVYERLLRAIDEKTARIEAALPDQFACRPGCHHCCLAVPTVLPVEWAYLAAHDLLPRQGAPSELHPGEAVCDRLRSDGACAVYPYRPVVCRTHGHLLLPEGGEIDHCPWNFGGLEEVEASQVFRLDDLHGSLLRVNLDFLRRNWPDQLAELARIRIRFHGS